VGGGITEALAAVLLALGVTTEVVKFSQGMQVCVCVSVPVSAACMRGMHARQQPRAPADGL
jgi:hypothetical protein